MWIWWLTTALAAPVTLDFEDLTFPGLGGQDISDVTGDAFLYTAGGFTIRDATGPNGLSRYGTQSAQYGDTQSTLLYQGTAFGRIEVAQASGAPFTPLSIDLGELLQADPVTVVFTGHKPDGSTVVHLFVTDGNAWATETTLFPSTFQGIELLTWDQAPPFHQFDNLILEPAPSPAGPLTAMAVASCPGTGPAAITWSGATPGGPSWVVWSSAVGLTSIPVGPCAGGTVNLSGQGIGLLAVATQGPDGDGVLATTEAPASICGRVVQVLDLTTCALSPPMVLD